MGEQFCLRWNNHQSTVVSVVESFLNSDSLTDCTLAAEGKYLKAHKLILTACSPYFEALLCQHHDKHPILILKDVKYYELKAMLDYMYRGEVNISQDQLDSFIKTAESLQIKGLTDQGGGGGGGGTSGPPETDSRDVGSTFKKKGGSHSSSTVPGSPQSTIPPREGSPTLKRRRRQNVAPPATTYPTADESIVPSPIPTDPTKMGAMTGSIIPKTEPPDTTIHSTIPPVKSETIEETAGEEIEDLTLDDDDEEDYGGGGDASQPGTSFEGNSQASQDYSQWQMATGDRTDEVFMAAQEAINNSQSNSQDPLFYVGDEELVGADSSDGVMSKEQIDEIKRKTQNKIRSRRYREKKRFDAIFRSHVCKHRLMTVEEEERIKRRKEQDKQKSQRYRDKKRATKLINLQTDPSSK